jgi:hypothetical protein
MVNDAGIPDRGGATRTSIPADRDPTCSLRGI